MEKRKKKKGKWGSYNMTPPNTPTELSNVLKLLEQPSTPNNINNMPLKKKTTEKSYSFEKIKQFLTGFPIWKDSDSLKNKDHLISLDLSRSVSTFASESHDAIQGIYCNIYNSIPFEESFTIKKSSVKKLLSLMRDEGFSIALLNNANIIFLKKETQQMLCFKHTGTIHYYGAAFSQGVLKYEFTFFYRPTTENFEVDSLIDKLNKLKEKPIKENKDFTDIFIVKQDKNGLKLVPHSIKPFDLNIDEYYEDLTDFHSKVTEWAKDDEAPNNRLVLMHGDPGTGKTNYIKYLINSIKGVRKIYIPPYLVSILTDPSFMDFIEQYKDSVIIIEDAENILVSRETSANSQAVSAVLNLTDGIMGSVLNFKFIATFNTDEENIDQALTRKGRLFMKHKFTPLSKKKTKALYNKLYNVDPPKNEMTLAEIFNSEENGVEKKEERKMGFL